MQTHCPVCGSAEKRLIEERHGTPIFLNRLEITREKALAAPLGDLVIFACDACGFVWNQAFDAARIVYDTDYENDQTHSSAFNMHLTAMADRVMAALPKGAPIDLLEIGCGQGVFIQALAKRAGARLRSAVGFDPAFRNLDLLKDTRIKVFGQYFDAGGLKCMDRPPNLVITRHTIEHVGDPVEFLRTIHKILSGVTAPVFVETPDVDWILRRGEIQDLFYEHCSLFTAASLMTALQRAGFGRVNVDHVFEGQYLWAEADMGGAVDARAGTRGEPPASANFADERQRFVATWKHRIREARGAVAVWGAGAKGVTFCFLVDPDGSAIDAVVDINPSKQQRFVPATGHSVVGPGELQDRGVNTVIVMNPNYRDEIAGMLAEMKLKAEILVLGNAVPSG